MKVAQKCAFGLKVSIGVDTLIQMGEAGQIGSLYGITDNILKLYITVPLIDII